jgi:hypothetical protein
MRHPLEGQRSRPRSGRQEGRRGNTLERTVLLFCAALVIASGSYCLAVLQSEFRSPIAAAPQLVLESPAVARAANPVQVDATSAVSTRRIDDGDTPAAIVARGWSAFATESKTPIRYAALESVPTQGPVRPRISPTTETTLVEFESSPFPYEGKLPGTNKPFLDVVEGGRRGHSTHGGRVYWADETYSDRRVLLHIPEQFDVDRPGVMIVFFHGNGATLSRDVRDRQQVPAQISASGINAVLVAPQFAVNAADSSAGRFWEPGVFGRFLGEAADQLARLYGDRQAARMFSKMPIVIVAYSGGYLPTLASLNKEGLKPRLRGIVLLDALYSGLDKFASWIASNRSGFFVSAYTHYTRGRNADLERMLSERAVAYDTELRRRPLPGSVTFLSTGADVLHRDFVTHAWVDNPIKDLLGRLAEYDTRAGTGTAQAGPRPAPIQSATAQPRD